MRPKLAERPPSCNAQQHQTVPSLFEDDDRGPAAGILTDAIAEEHPPDAIERSRQLRQVCQPS